MEEANAKRKALAEKWDRMMQPIRERYAEQLQEIESSKRIFFRYEHPDLVREGIVWSGS